MLTISKIMKIGRIPRKGIAMPYPVKCSYDINITCFVWKIVVKCEQLNGIIAIDLRQCVGLTLEPSLL